jgi:hypothetical protein
MNIIALMMEAARSSETSVNFYQTTWRYNPEHSNLRTHRRENLNSYLKSFGTLKCILPNPIAFLLLDCDTSVSSICTPVCRIDINDTG